jgi:glycosyltransferase involved in cell wall biosynthesis
MSLGFRSSFNFIPEGEYAARAELREWLVLNGFELGVHDLHHDGKLYHSRDGFTEKAHRINYYLERWSATGFRSGFMHHQLEWIHDLNILYDASTFDTDPFEPQPDSAGTIFPFWVSAPEGSKRPGYVELPYTLPQDSTLFLVLKETTPEIWLKKLDWIANQGGMALLNVHPDYIDFSGRGNSRQFSVSAYRTLLEHVRKQYEGQYWHALAKDLASWYKSTLPAAPVPSANSVTTEIAPPGPKLAGKRVAVLLYSTYPADPRPRRAAEAMTQAGAEVDLFCLGEEQDEPARESVGGVNVFRLPMARKRGGKASYLWQYGRFLLAAWRFVTFRDLRRRYDIVHVHNMPDFLAFAALLPKLRGAKVILDLHDPMPELMMAIYELSSGHWMVKTLRTLERWSIRTADLVLTPNITFRNLFIERGCPPRKIEIIMNSPRPDIFESGNMGAPRNGTRKSGVFRIMHHGLIAHRHGVDLLVDAVAQVRTAIPGVQLHIYGGRTSFLEVVLNRAAELGIAERVFYHGPQKQEAIADAIREADLGVIPNRRSSFTEQNFPTRIFEYLALGCPVIAPSTQGIRDYFPPDRLVYFEPGIVSDLANRIEWVSANVLHTQEIVNRGREIYNRHLWSSERARLLNLAANMIPAS